jgi:TolB-like protein
MSNTIGRRVRFGRNSFELATGRLWVEEVEVKLTRRSAEVLGLLVERAGHPVSKQDLFAAVWRNVVVGDDALAGCVQELRRALGDDARQPRYIETRHRYGYSFVAPVTTETISRDLAAIAVLPFTDMSPERDQSYFCEGVAEELIDALNQVEGLRVACRSCSFKFRDACVDVREVGRELAVSAVVQGSVRKAGEQLRITVQLVDAASGYHEWSRRFEHAIGNVFEIQDEIAETVALSLRAAMLPAAIFRPADRPPPTADSLPPVGAPGSRDFEALLLPRTQTRSTGPGNTRRLPVSSEACSLDA